MENYTVAIRKGEKQPVYGTITAASGTVNIGAASPQTGVTVTVYDNTGTPVPGMNAVAVTGNTTGAQAQVQAWYLLDTTSFTAKTVYRVVFTIPVTGSDGIARVEEPSVLVFVEA